MIIGTKFSLVCLQALEVASSAANRNDIKRIASELGSPFRACHCVCEFAIFPSLRVIFNKQTDSGFRKKNKKNKQQFEFLAIQINYLLSLLLLLGGG